MLPKKSCFRISHPAITDALPADNLTRVYTVFNVTELLAHTSGITNKNLALGSHILQMIQQKQLQLTWPGGDEIFPEKKAGKENQHN